MCTERRALVNDNNKAAGSRRGRRLIGAKGTMGKAEEKRAAIVAQQAAREIAASQATPSDGKVRPQR